MPERRRSRRHWLICGAVFALAILPMLNIVGCAISTPYRSADTGGAATENDTVLVVLTHAELAEGTEDASTFWSNVSAVADSLDGRPGFVGYRLRRELFGRNSWTMTVWADAASLDAFVQGDIHQTAIREGWPALARARFARVTLPRSEIPISWEQVEALLDATGREYVNNQHR